MPTIQVFTNLSFTDQQKNELLEQFTKVITDVIKKPKAYAMVQIIDKVTTAFGGSTSPAAFVKVVSIGSQIPKKTADACCTVLTKVSKELKQERIYVHLVPVDHENFAYYV